MAGLDRFEFWHSNNVTWNRLGNGDLFFAQYLDHARDGFFGVGGVVLDRHTWGHRAAQDTHIIELSDEGV